MAVAPSAELAFQVCSQSLKQGSGGSGRALPPSFSRHHCFAFLRSKNENSYPSTVCSRLLHLSVATVAGFRPAHGYPQPACRKNGDAAEGPSIVDCWGGTREPASFHAGGRRSG